MENERNRFSYSDLFLYKWCPRNYKYTRVAKYQPEYPKNISTIVGRASHRVIEAMYLSEDFSCDFLLTNWPSIYQEELALEKYKFATPELAKRWDRIGCNILRKFHEMAKVEGILIRPVGVEWKFKLPVEAVSGRQFLIVGVVDLIVRPFSRGGDLRIIDTKTGSYQVTDQELKTNDQLTIYSLAVRQIMKEVETRVGFFYPRYGSVRWSTRSDIDHRQIIEVIDQTWQSIEQKKFDPTYNKCNMCSHRKRCAAEDWAKETGLPLGWAFPRS